MYLLDTNHCSLILVANPAIIKKLEQLGDEPVSTCVIVRGELIFMVHKSKRKAENLANVSHFLNETKIFDVDQKTADIYGKIKAGVIDRFAPKSNKEREKTKIEQIGFKENDLWIAAVAKRNNCVLVTTDGDFERVKQVEDIQTENWSA